MISGLVGIASAGLIISIISTYYFIMKENLDGVVGMFTVTLVFFLGLLIGIGS